MVACTYVEVMKMGVRLEIPISENTDLSGFQKKVAEEYWKYVSGTSKVSPHGDSRYIGISTANYVPIETDKDFQEYKDLGKVFNARVNHASLRN